MNRRFTFNPTPLGRMDGAIQDDDHYLYSQEALAYLESLFFMLTLLDPQRLAKATDQSAESVTTAFESYGTLAGVLIGVLYAGLDQVEGMRKELLESRGGRRDESSDG